MKRFMLVAISAFFLLTGCASYNTEDESQRYYKIVENFGQRINVDGTEFCYTNPFDTSLVNCFQNVQNPYLEGLWILPELQETLAIYRNTETGMMELEFADGTISQLVFGDQNHFFIIGSTETLIVKIEAFKNSGVFTLEDGTTFKMQRLIQGDPT